MSLFSMSRCLPVHIDVGTNRKEYRECPKVKNRLLRCRHTTPLRLSQITRFCHFHSHSSNNDCLLCGDVSFLLISSLSLQVSSHPFCFLLFSSLLSFLLSSHLFSFLFSTWVFAKKGTDPPHTESSSRNSSMPATTSTVAKCSCR